MDRQELFKEVLKVNSGGELEDKLIMLGPLLVLFHRTLTEDELCRHLEDFEINYMDYEILDVIKHHITILHHSGAINVLNREINSLVDSELPQAFQAMTDEGITDWLRNLEGQADSMRESMSEAGIE